MLRYFRVFICSGLLIASCFAAAREVRAALNGKTFSGLVNNAGIAADKAGTTAEAILDLFIDSIARR